ncbi:uncharacterized protein [Miscanthus floridulus]|uniref:uncharacterized protein n=1 Tax=Miscanthus floridulus TaxID=154761 RepID=UPI003458D373
MAARGSFVLDMVRPLAALMPAVWPTDRAVLFHRCMLYTGLCVSVFMVCSHLPLYGVRYAASGADPLYCVRSILASNRERPPGPGPHGQCAEGARRTIGLGEAAAYILLGMYGPVDALNGALIVLQLFSASVLVVFLDELFDKGYGLQAFSPVTVNTGRGPEFEGIVLAIIHQAVVGADNTRALVATMLCHHLPNMMNLLATCLVLLTAVYLEGIRMLLPLQLRERRGRRVSFPIKLLYTSTMPIFLYSAMVSALYMVPQLLHYSRFGGGVLGRLLGVWKEASYAAVPVGGLAYYITPPSSVAANPLHALIYTVLLLASCALLSQFWVITLGSSVRDVARQLTDQRLAMPGRRDGATYAQLKRHIPMAAAVGGLCVGALFIFADMTGAIGSGTGIMLAATVAYNLVDSFHKED